MTYQVVTPESAEYGDVAEYGWALPGGWRFALEDEDGRHDDVLRDVQDNPDSYTAADTVHDLVDLARDLGFYSDGSDWLTTEPEQDYATGEETTYHLHIDGVTPSTYGRIVRLIDV
jgi:hypothetical protein